ncbi:MAG: hypothetical protein J5973_09425, partial [Eubacterium sp.]|nr:hypothetical protein [Eubacterium sp.]
MKKVSGSETKEYGFADLQWEACFLTPHTFGEDKKETSTAPRPDRFIQYRDSILHIRVPEGTGKITDCGYDQITCLYTRIPAKYDVIFRADVWVYEFMKSGFPTFQEGFGLFLRDTMETDPETGYLYSNMAAAGVGLGRYNFWGRTGCTAESLEDIQNFSAFGKPADTDPLRAVKGSPIVLRLMIGKTEAGLCASVLNREGKNLLAQEAAGDIYASQNGISVGPDGVCRIAAPGDMLFQRDPEFLYLGFMAAGGCEMSVNPASVSLELRDRDAGNAKVAVPDKSVPSILCVSPEGSCISDGSPELPYDLQTAVRRCKAGQAICVLPGRYELYDDVILGGKPGVSEVKNCRIFCEQKHRAVLDFGGRSGSLIVSGDYWEVDGLAVTGGMGIQIRGSYNRVVNCKTYENLETGILIRHPDNGSDREWWPSYNVIEDCISFCNRDPSGHNADGFACKIAGGEGNRFLRCFAWLNTDDGFDLFAKNRKIGAVFLQGCRSWMNGYSLTEEGTLRETEGNGNG